MGAQSPGSRGRGDPGGLLTMLSRLAVFRLSLVFSQFWKVGVVYVFMNEEACIQRRSAAWLRSHSLLVVEPEA